MKKIILFTLILLFGSFSSYSQDCNIGNQDTIGFNTIGSFSPDFLLGVKFTLAAKGTLTSLNLIGTNAGVQARMAIYADNSGTPGNLITSTDSQNVGTGVISFPVLPTQLAPGDYWIMAIYNSDAIPTYKKTGTSNSVYYYSMPFASPVPSTGAGFTGYTGQDFTYFAGILCSTNCNIGNQDSTAGYTNAGDPIFQNYLLGVKYTLASTGTLKSLNLIGRNTGAQARMAVYTDNGGAPGNLIASTDSQTVGAGVISFPVASTILAPGDYWILAIYNGDGGHTYNKDSSGISGSYYAMPFASAIPSTGAGFTAYPGVAFTYFLGIDCGMNCNIGNQDPTGYTDANDPINQDFLLGTKFNLESSGTLTSLNLIGRNTGAQARMALYTDISGAPGNLIVATDSQTVGAGIISFPVSSSVLSPGAYWIMAIYNASAGHSYNTPDAGNVLYYIAMPFASTIPSTGTGFIAYPGLDVTYFIGIDCIPSGISENARPSGISVYPNPSSGYIYISGLKELTEISITDISGRIVTQTRIEKNDVIDINKLSSGIYILKAAGNSPVKFVKY